MISINTSVIVSTLPNIGEEQLKFSVNQATTFLSSIDDEQHTFIDGDWDYKLNERFVHNTTDVEIIGYTTSTSIVYTFDNGVDFQSMEKMIETEKIKKLRKGNHYIQQVIDKEIEKITTNEN